MDWRLRRQQPVEYPFFLTLAFRTTLMKTPLLFPKLPAPVAPELALRAHEGTPRYGEYGPPSAAQVTAAAQAVAEEHRANLARFDARYAGGNVYDLLDAQTTW